MYAKLTIPERLKDLRVVDKHLTLEQLAEQTGLSKSALGKYETDDYKDISPFAIATLADFYGVSTDYLMGLTENKNHPNTELQSLHLSDDMVELLSSGKINNRLLCELATHPCKLVTGFQFLGDTLRLLHLRDDTRQPVSGLFVQVSKICPEFSRQKQGIVLTGPVFLQKRLVHPAPPSNGATFLRQLQIGDVVVSYQRVADAVLMDFLW